MRDLIRPIDELWRWRERRLAAPAADETPHRT
jgi:hypothetical protein